MEGQDWSSDTCKNYSVLIETPAAPPDPRTGSAKSLTKVSEGGKRRKEFGVRLTRDGISLGSNLVRLLTTAFTPEADYAQLTTAAKVSRIDTSHGL